MADNVAITAGSGTTIRTDDVAGVQYQVVKLDVGGDGATVTPSTDSTLASLAVTPRVKRVRVAVTPTISAAGIYAAKDAIGGIMSFTSAVRASGGSGIIREVVLVDKDQEMAAIDLVLFTATIAGTVTDNSPFDPTDADMANIVGVVKFAATASGDYVDFTDNSVAAKSVEIPFLCDATTLFGALVARGTPTYTATTDITVTLTIDQD